MQFGIHQGLSELLHRNQYVQIELWIEQKQLMLKKKIVLFQIFYIHILFFSTWIIILYRALL